MSSDPYFPNTISDIIFSTKLVIGTAWWNERHIRYKTSSLSLTLIARFMGPSWGPSGADRTQVGPTLAPWTLLFEECRLRLQACYITQWGEYRIVGSWKLKSVIKVYYNIRSPKHQIKHIKLTPISILHSDTYNDSQCLLALAHRGQVTLLCIIKLGYQWFR